MASARETSGEPWQPFGVNASNPGGVQGHHLGNGIAPVATLCHVLCVAERCISVAHALAMLTGFQPGAVGLPEKP